MHRLFAIFAASVALLRRIDPQLYLFVITLLCEYIPALAWLILESPLFLRNKDDSKESLVLSREDNATIVGYIHIFDILAAD